MTPFQEILLPAVAGNATLLFFARYRIQEALDNFNRRGGPPAPMHPSTAGVVPLLRPNPRKLRPRDSHRTFRVVT
jgi:hypothetical protein